MLTKQEFLRRHNISTNPNANANANSKTAGMSSPNTPNHPQTPRSVFDIQFGSMPILIPRSNSAPIFSPNNEEKVNPDILPRRGSFSRPPNFVPVSSFTSLPASESLIHHRIELLNDNEGQLRLLRMEINPDSGELYRDDVTPPFYGKAIPGPKPTRDQQRSYVGERPYKPLANMRCRVLIQQAELRQQAIDRAALVEHAIAIRADIAAAAAGRLTPEQQAQLDLQARIQRRADSREASRRA